MCNRYLEEHPKVYSSTIIRIESAYLFRCPRDGTPLETEYEMKRIFQISLELTRLIWNLPKNFQFQIFALFAHFSG